MDIRKGANLKKKQVDGSIMDVWKMGNANLQ